MPLFLERIRVFLFLDTFNDVLARFKIFNYNFRPNHLFNFVVRMIVNRIPSSCLGQLCFVRIYDLLFRHRKTPELFWIRLDNLAYVCNPVMFQMLIAFELDLILIKTSLCLPFHALISAAAYVARLSSASN